MRIVTALLMVILMSCDSPSPSMRGADKLEAHLEGYSFTVWRLGPNVEVIRHGMAARSDQRRLQTLMTRVAESTTACDLRPGSVTGDTGVLRATLDCN